MPFLSRVNGTISGPQLAKKVKVAEKKEPVDVFLRTQIEVATDRAVTLSANGADTADLWVDSKPVQGIRTSRHTLPLENTLLSFGLMEKTSCKLSVCVTRCHVSYRDKGQHAQHVVVSLYGAWYFSLLPQRHRTVLTQLGCNTHLPLEIVLEQTP